MQTKGQILTYDFMAAMSIFIFLVIIIETYWVHWTNEIVERRKFNDMNSNLFLASEIWFKEGYPKYWNLSNVKEIGLSNDHEINWTKLQYLKQMGYQKFLSLSGLKFNVYFRVINQSETIFEFPTSGFPTQYSNLIKIERFGILNSSIVKIQTFVWD